MKKLKLGELGGMPVKHETVDVVQQSILDVLEAFYSSLPIRNAGKYVVSGVYQQGNVLSDGYVILDGELMKVVGAGPGLYLKIQENVTTDTFKDSSVKITIEDRFLLKTDNQTDAFHIDTFIRINGHSDVVQGDCTYLGGRTFSYQLQELVASIETKRVQGEALSSGFILNRIIPFSGMPNGYELIIKLGDKTGLTFLPKGGVDSNIRFIANPYSSAPATVLPVFGTSNFIGTLNSGGFPGIGYDFNVHVKLVWSQSEQVWVEVFRNSMSQSV